MTAKGSRRGSTSTFWPAPIGNWERISISPHFAIAPRSTKFMAESRCTLLANVHRPCIWIHKNSAFEEGEYITTEYSYKYTLKGFERLALRAGFER